MTVSTDDPYGHDGVAGRVGQLEEHGYYDSAADAIDDAVHGAAESTREATAKRLRASHRQGHHPDGNSIIAACFITGLQVNSVDCPLCVDRAETTWRYGDGGPYRHGAAQRR
jgi:hypothetical protein